MGSLKAGSGLFRTFKLLCLLLAPLMMAVPALSMAATLPQMTVRTLAGEELSWPAELPAGTSALILVQQQDQQADAAAWLQFLESAEAGPREIFIVPLLSPNLLIVRGVVEETIRMAAADPEQLKRTVPLFRDAAELQTALGLPAGSDIQVVLVDAHGMILAGATGSYSAEAGQQLLDALSPPQIEPQDAVACGHTAPSEAGLAD